MHNATRYHPFAILLHWLTALAIVALFALGWIMVNLQTGSSLQFALFQWHKSVGFTVLALAVIRLGWRAAHPAPPLPEAMADWEKLAARLGHLGLYALTVALPLTGWAMISTSRFNIPTLLYGMIPIPHLAILADSPDKAAIHHLAEELHEAAAWGLAALLTVHIGAALRHHLVLKDDILRRMLPALMLAIAVLGWTPPATAADWLIDAGHSRLGFTGSQGGSPFSGAFARWHGDISFDPPHPEAGHASITIETASAATGDSDKDQLLPQPE